MSDSWDSAWRAAIEGGLLGSTTHVGRGRSALRQGKLSQIDVEPGLLAARVEAGPSSDVERFVAQISVRPLTDAEWAALVAATAEHGVLAAAVLTGELAFALEATEAGAHLLPQAAELSIDCTCPDWTEACPHVSALALAFADILTADAWALLTLRGRDRAELTEQVRALQASADGGEVEAASAEGPREPDAGMAASTAYRRALGPLPGGGPIPRHVGSRLAWTATPPADSGIDPAELQREVDDAARRAVDLLTGVSTRSTAAGVEHDEVRTDLARRAHHADDRAAFAARIGVEATEVERWAIAWRHGGAAGCAVLDERWEPPDHVLARGAAAFEVVTASGDSRPRIRSSANVVTCGRRQLRLDRAGSWWRFDADESLGWILASGGFSEPADALDH